MPLLSQVHEILRVTFQKLIARCHMPDCSGLRPLVSTSDVVTLIFVFSFFGFISLEMKLVALHYIVFKVQVLVNTEQLTENRLNSLTLILPSPAFHFSRLQSTSSSENSFCSLISVSYSLVRLDIFSTSSRKNNHFCLRKNLFIRLDIVSLTNFACEMLHYCNLSACGKLFANPSPWWAQVESNHRPHAYQACALTI